MKMRDHIEAVGAIMLGVVLVYFSVSSAQDTGYEKGYAKAKAEYNLPIIKAETTPYKVRPNKYVERACPPAVIIQAPPEKIVE